jgi:hypothetical protein
VGLLRIHKGRLTRCGTFEIGRQQRGGEKKQQLAQRQDVEIGEKGKGLYRQQQSDEQPDNIVLRYTFAV